MSILNVNTIQPVGSAQTVTVNATDFKIGSTTLNSSGLVNASAGSTSAPSISPVGDSNTGIFFPASDTVAIGEGGTEVIRVDSSGRVGVGTNIMTRPFEVWAGTAGTSFSVDSSGRITKPFQPYFYATRSGNQTNFNMTSGSTSVVVYNATSVNIGNHYSTSTGLFTAPVSGMYAFSAAATTNVTSEELWWIVNGTRTTTPLHPVSTTLGKAVDIVYLNANDTIGIHPYDSGGSTTATIEENAAHTYFKGYLIG